MAWVRYLLALLLVMFMPGAVLYWLSIHPFIHFWRRVGTYITLRLHLVAILLLAFAIFLFRGRLLSVEYGNNALLAILGIGLYAAGALYGIQIKRQLKKRTLIGVPELAPGSRGIPIMAEGVYARHRHPRYLQLMLMTGGLALIANYLAAYVAFALTVAVILIIIPLEERELRERFGEEYADYSARTPRLIPRLRRRGES